MAKRKRAAAVPLLLPPPADQFIGRRAELDRLVSALQPGQMVTVVGEPGIGKRSLAAAAIERLRQGDAPPRSFPAGVITLSCDQYPNDHLLLSALARSLGGSAYPDLASSVVALLGDKRLLIVLEDIDLLQPRLFQEEDYLEIVSPAEDDGAAAAQDAAALQNQEQVLAQICALLDNGQCCLLLTTSESALARGEVIELGPLSEAEGRALLAIYSEDVLDNLQDSTRIVELLGGFPLSLVLGGYWLDAQATSVAELRAGLEAQNLAQLSPDDRRAAGLTAVMQLSMREFDDAARTALRLLSMLATAPLPAPMVGGIISPLGADEPDEPDPGKIVDDTLAAFQKGIVILTDLAAMGLLVEQDAGLQYRHYLVQELAGSEQHHAEIAGQGFIAQLADMIERILSFAEMAGEEDAALAPGLAAHLLHLQGALYANHLWAYACEIGVRSIGYFALPGYWYELFDMTRLAYRAVRRLEQPDLAGEYLLGIGLMLGRLELAQDAATALAQGLEAADESGDEELVLQAVELLLVAQREAGDTAAARQSAERLAVLAEQQDEPQVLAGALFILAQVLIEGEDRDAHLARAGELVERALGLQRQQGEQDAQLLDAIITASIIWSAIGDTARALQYDEEALELARRLRDRVREAAVLINLGHNYSKQGEARRALRTFEKALEVAQRTKAKPLIAMSSWRLANSVEQSGSTRAALKYYEQCLAALDPAELGDPTPAEVQAKIAALRNQTKA